MHLRSTCNEDWWKSEDQKLKYRAVFQDPGDGEEYGLLGVEEKTGNLHFRTLTPKGDGEFWSQAKEDFIFAARSRGYKLLETSILQEASFKKSGKNQINVKRLTYFSNKVNYSERQRCVQRILHRSLPALRTSHQLWTDRAPIVQRQRYIPAALKEFFLLQIPVLIRFILAPLLYHIREGGK